MNKSRKINPKKVVDKIRHILIEKRKSQQMRRYQLAEKLEVNPSTALRIENGDFELTFERFLEICTILNLDPVKVLKDAMS